MPAKQRKSRVESLFDDWFIPMAFGVLTVAVCVQAMSYIPGVRTVMDRVEGRFVAQPATTLPSAILNDSAVVTLTVGAGQNGTGTEVLLNGRSLGNFTTNQMQVTVHHGDQIQFDDLNGANVTISVDTNDSQLLLPATGQSVQLNESHRHGALSAAEFI